MKLSSLRARFGLLFLVLFLLVTLSVGGSFWILDTQKQDALLINLAGRQRMLVQQMARVALEIEVDGERTPHDQFLQEASQTFEKTLTALQSGGAAPYQSGGTAMLSGARDAGLIARLKEVETTWHLYRAELGTILIYPPDSTEFLAALDQVTRLTPILVSQSGEAVHLIESGSAQKVVRLRWIQGIFLLSALMVLGGGAWMVIKFYGYDEKKAPPVRDYTGNQTGGQTELAALYRASQEISAELALTRVLPAITENTRQLLNSDVACLCLLDEAGQKLMLHSASGADGAIRQNSSPAHTNAVKRVLGGERAVCLADQGCQPVCQIMTEAYRSSHLVAPLRVDKEIIGGLCLGSVKPEQFREDAVETLTSLANVASAALHNARLYEQADRQATSEERQRIAADLHDGLAQSLSSTKLAVNQATTLFEKGRIYEAITNLEKVNTALDQALAETRQAINNLQESDTPEVPLQEQCARLAEEISGDSAAVEWVSHVQTPVRLAPQVNLQVNHIVEEALLNARRHSGAGLITLRLEQVDIEYVLTVEDNGRGFDPDNPVIENGKQHFGLAIMQARAGRFGGRLIIFSSPGAGTRVCLRWPIQGVAA